MDKLNEVIRKLNVNKNARLKALTQNMKLSKENTGPSPSASSDTNNDSQYR